MNISLFLCLYSLTIIKPKTDLYCRSHENGQYCVCCFLKCFILTQKKVMNHRSGDTTLLPIGPGDPELPNVWSAVGPLSERCLASRQLRSFLLNFDPHLSIKVSQMFSRPSNQSVFCAAQRGVVNLQTISMKRQQKAYLK